MHPGLYVAQFSGASGLDLYFGSGWQISFFPANSILFFRWTWIWTIFGGDFFSWILHQLRHEATKIESFETKKIKLWKIEIFHLPFLATRVWYRIFHSPLFPVKSNLINGNQRNYSNHLCSGRKKIKFCVLNGRVVRDTWEPFLRPHFYAKPKGKKTQNHSQGLHVWDTKVILPLMSSIGAISPKGSR